MDERIATESGLTIGLDPGDRFTEGRVLDASGEGIEALRLRTKQTALSSRLSATRPRGS